jgi:hypothetical protein
MAVSTVSTVSTVNMYMLSDSGPYIPPIVYNLVSSNVSFPSGYTGVDIMMAGFTIRNRRITFTPSTFISYRD